MPKTELEADQSLKGARVAISVSDSNDLARLGLGPQHCEAAVAEIVRGVFLAGGDVLYGGRLQPLGFTQTMIHEAEQFAARARALSLYVPYTEWVGLNRKDLSKILRSLRRSIELILLDVRGLPVSSDTACDSPVAKKLGPAPTALTAMRKRLAGDATAAVVVGGKLTQSPPRGAVKGAGPKRDLRAEYWIPGVVQEARIALDERIPLYCAGGFGGAAAAVARAITADVLGWGPPDFPADEDSEPARTELQNLRNSRPSPVDDGLTPDERGRLLSSHRPGEIATLIVLGLSRLSNRSTTPLTP